jgi:hypothetical protein
LAVDATDLPWSKRAEAAIRSLRDVEGASVQIEDDDIREIHVLTSSARPAKQIVRDVQTLLLTRFNRSIDHRVVSVAYARPGPTLTPHAPAGPAAEGPAAESEEQSPHRIRFGSVNLYVASGRAQAQVELGWKGLTRLGTASGSATREGAYGLIATATLGAVQEFLEDGFVLSLQDIDLLTLGKQDVVVVSLSLLAHRSQKTLVGCCTVEQDTQQAVVLATLSALNRVMGGLRTREPTEYVLRPASTEETSEAKTRIE